MFELIKKKRYEKIKLSNVIQDVVQDEFRDHRRGMIFELIENKQTKKLRKKKT